MSIASVILLWWARQAVEYLAVLPFFIVTFCVLPDYVTLLKTRFVLSVIVRRKRPVERLLLIACDVYLTTLFASGFIWSGSAFLSWSHKILPDAGVDFFHSVTLGMRVAFNALALLFVMNGHTAYWSLGGLAGVWGPGKPLVLYPALFTDAWLLLYAGSGFLLQAARRFDVGFQWFNSTADIEKKPLSAIGLVAGAIVAIVYWASVGGAWMVQHLRQ